MTAKYFREVSATPKKTSRAANIRRAVNTAFDAACIIPCFVKVRDLALAAEMQNVKSDDWSATARSYANMPSEGPHILPSRLLLKSMNEVSPISNASAILDVGCGPGTTIAMLIDEYDSQIPAGARLIASDFSSGMIELVSERKKREINNAKWQRLETKVLDAHDLSQIPDSSLSHVTGSMVYNLVPNGRKALAAAFRVLETGGVIALSIFARVEWMDLLALAAKKIRADEAPEFEFPKGFNSVEGIRGEFEAVGFRSEQVVEVDTFMDVTDSSFVVNSFLRSNNPGVMHFVGDYSKKEKDQFVEEWLALVDERYPDPPKKLRAVAVIAVGRK